MTSPLPPTTTPTQEVDFFFFFFAKEVTCCNSFLCTVSREHQGDWTPTMEALSDRREKAWVHKGHASMDARNHGCQLKEEAREYGWGRDRDRDRDRDRRGRVFIKAHATLAPCSGARLDLGLAPFAVQDGLVFGTHSYQINGIFFS